MNSEIIDLSTRKSEGIDGNAKPSDSTHFEGDQISENSSQRSGRSSSGRSTSSIDGRPLSASHVRYFNSSAKNRADDAKISTGHVSTLFVSSFPILN